MWITDPAARRPKGSNVGEADMRVVVHARVRVCQARRRTGLWEPLLTRGPSLFLLFLALGRHHQYSGRDEYENNG